MTRNLMRLLGILATVAMAGCDQSSSATDTTTATDTAATDTNSPADAVVAEVAVDAVADVAAEAAAPLTVTVTHGALSKDVDLGSLPADPFTYQDAPGPFAKLSDVVAAADATIDPAKVTFDIADPTGAKPDSKSNCASIVPFDGANLSKAHIDRTTRNVKWDADLSYPGCASWKNVAVIEVVDK